MLNSSSGTTTKAFLSFSSKILTIASFAGTIAFLINTAGSSSYNTKSIFSLPSSFKIPAILLPFSPIQEPIASTFGLLDIRATLHLIPGSLTTWYISIVPFSTSPHPSSQTSALALSIGIAIQNFPEGAIISMPLKDNSVSRSKAFCYGMLSGIVEPIFGLITVLISHMIKPWLPGFLSFAAGAMIYVVIEELIPESQDGEHSNIGTIGAALGFTLMMILDVALG